MLERIETIKGVGLLYNVNGKPFKLERTQLIYADNGRGKSTLASVLRSVSSGDSSVIIERRTVDGETDPEVVLAFANGHKVKFVQGEWSETRPEIIVFDSEFIEKNVHSGGVVTPGQRKNLLQFALGAPAVQARLAEEKATSKSIEANQAVAQVTAQLSGYHQGLSLPAFIKIPPLAEVAVQSDLAELRKRLLITRDINKILTRGLPQPIKVPTFDLKAFFEILALSLDDVHENAEALVEAHLKSNPISGFESWISDGRKFDNGEVCPYCAQDASKSDLMQAYKTHFNEQYHELKRKVSLLARGLELRAGVSVAHEAESAFSSVLAVVGSWTSEVEVTMPAFDDKKARENLEALRYYLSLLIDSKVAKPLEPIDDPMLLSTAVEMWNDFTRIIEELNAQISIVREQLENYKAGIQSENESVLAQAIYKLEVAITRGKPEVEGLISDLASLKADAKNADAQKKAAREALEVHMASTLSSFQDDINKILNRFGASFSIEKMDANFRKGARSEYGIKMRGKSIALDGPPRFSTALSEGDKRTLAYAFFMSTTFSRKDLNQTIVVIDDPMCSLDANRRSETKSTLKELAAKSLQLIVLAHDPFFIRELKSAFSSKDSAPIQVYRLKHAHQGYSNLSRFDVDQECESDFYKHHRTLSDFCSGADVESRSVAKVIRPFLEGYLHRRFPGLLPKDCMFGQVITIISEATEPSPLVHAYQLISELQSINSYAGRFHHDTNPDTYQTITVVDSELLNYGQRALNLVYKGTI